MTRPVSKQKTHISAHTVRRRAGNMMMKTGHENGIEMASNATAMGLAVHEKNRTENRSQKGGQKP